MPTKKKIAVLGGGIGGLSAAFHLTEQEGWEDEYDITVYQMGWRLGGKCASGRDQREGFGNRIYEHGLHLFGGFYHHSFDLLTRAYAALDRSEDHPNAKVWDAFTGLDAITFMEACKDESGRVHHIPWYVNMEPNALVPGTETHSPTILQMVQAMAAKLFQFQPQAGGEKGGDIPFDDLPDDADESLLDRLVSAPFDLIEKLEHEITEAVAELGAYVLMRTLVRSIEKRLEAMAAKEPPAGSQAIRNFLNIAFLVQAVITGIIEDKILDRGWDSIDDEEFSDWIERHAVTVARDIKKDDDPYERARELVDWAAVRAIYDYVFGYLDGDTQKRALGAGTGMRGILRLSLTYRGHLFYAMRGGMGDVVIAPIYLALEKRGVKFQFFNRVLALRPNANEQTIDSIEIFEQAKAKDGDYKPLIDVPVAGWDHPLECWPEEPLWDQLVDGDALKGTNFEWTLGDQPAPNKVLQRGTDFDEIVLAIPVGALHTICADLHAQRERWQLMLGALKTVPTLAMQLWFRRTTDDLGALPGRTQTAMIQPFSTWADMTHILTREDWRGDERPLSVGYFCGQMPPEMPRDHSAHHVVGEAAKTWLTTTAPLLWSRAAKPGQGLDYNLLFDPRGGMGGTKFEGQYWRANVCPSEQYVLSVPGTLDARLRTEQSGYANLFLAGDWTRNGLNAGAAEAAAMSGLQCANAMRGDLSPVIGETDLA